MTSSSSVSGRPRRPGGVTLLAVLIVISGLLGLIGSIAVIIGRTNDDVLRLLHRIETLQLAAYVRAIPLLQLGKVRAAAMALFANDAQHVTILRLQLGLDPVPAAFVTGRSSGDAECLDQAVPAGDAVTW